MVCWKHEIPGKIVLGILFIEMFIVSWSKPEGKGACVPDERHAEFAEVETPSSRTAQSPSIAKGAWAGRGSVLVVFRERKVAGNVAVSKGLFWDCALVRNQKMMIKYIYIYIYIYSIEIPNFVS